MMIEFANVKGFFFKRKIKKAAECAFKQTGQTFEKLKFSLSFITASEIRELNLKFRGKDAETDVLSFPMLQIKPFELITTEKFKNYVDNKEGSLFIGDIVICTSVAEKQSREFGNTLKSEIIFLTMHGLLHLLGFDHETEEDDKLMKTVIDNVLSICKIDVKEVR